jgi:hypothetical protein
MGGFGVEFQIRVCFSSRKTKNQSRPAPEKTEKTTRNPLYGIYIDLLKILARNYYYSNGNLNFTVIICLNRVLDRILG